MKIPFTVLLAGFCVSVAVADVETRRAEALGKPMETFRTMEGRIYRDVLITKIDGGGVSFKHADGAARLRFYELSPGQRKYFGLDEENALEVYRKEEERRAAYEKLVEIRTEERRVRAEKDATEREESRQDAMAAVAEELAKAVVEPTAAIPPYPTIKRVDTRVRRSRSYGSSYRPFYGGYYGYSPYSSYRPSHHGGWHPGSYHCPTPSIIIRRWAESQ